jgi:hypothetical protein
LTCQPFHNFSDVKWKLCTLRWWPTGINLREKQMQVSCKFNDSHRCSLDEILQTESALTKLSKLKRYTCDRQYKST